jgi:hypothetical protein
MDEIGPIKDWRAEEAYEYLKGEERTEKWAWEFLRRNPKYQQTWLEVSKEYLPEASRYLAHSFVRESWAEIIEQISTAPDDDLFMVPRSYFEGCYEYGLKLGLLNPKTDSPGWIRIRSNVSAEVLRGQEVSIDPENFHLLNFNYNQDPLIETLPTEEEEVCYKKGEPSVRHYLIGLQDLQVGVVFDLSQPLDRQWVQIQESLLREQERLGFKCSKDMVFNFLGDTWIELLRILDGLDTPGVGDSEIKNHLFRKDPNKHQAYPQKRDRARMLMNAPHKIASYLPKKDKKKEAVSKLEEKLFPSQIKCK